MVCARLPEELVERMGATANRSRVIVAALEQYFGGSDGGTERVVDAGRGEKSKAGTVKRKGDGTAVPILPAAKSEEERLHPVSAVRSELADRGGRDQRSPDTTHEGHHTFRAGENRYCSNCKVMY